MTMMTVLEHVGGSVSRKVTVPVFTKDEAKFMLRYKDWEIGSDCYDPNNRNTKIASSAEYIGDDGLPKRLYFR